MAQTSLEPHLKKLMRQLKATQDRNRRLVLLEAAVLLAVVAAVLFLSFAVGHSPAPPDPATKPNP